MIHPGIQNLHLGCGEPLNCELLKGLASRSRCFLRKSVTQGIKRKMAKVSKTKK